MAWLYVPNCAPSPSAPGSEDLTSAYVWRCRTLARSATWRGKPLPPRAWSRQWKRGGFIRLLSGLTCEPSTLERGVEAWISSLRATPARATPLPASGSASLTTAGCWTGPLTSSPPAGLVISSAKTCRGTRTDSSPLPFRHWSDWAAALRAEYSARRKPETPCAASDCSSWPSARVTRGAYTRDQGNPELPRLTLEGMAENWAAPRTSDTNGAGLHGDGGMDLRTQASTWSAPKATDAEHGGPNMAYSSGDTLPLPSQAAQWEAPSVAVTAGSRLTRSGLRADELLLTGQALETSQWAAPCAQNYKGSSEGSIVRQDGKSRMDLLHYQAEQAFDPGHFLPPSSPDQPTAAGSTCLTASLNTSPPSVRRKLNPIFVEALMRWPTGLSGFARQETAWTRWWLLMPSFVSALVSTCGETEQMDLFA